MGKKYSVISTLFIAQRAVISIDLTLKEAKELANSSNLGADVYESFSYEETTPEHRKEYRKFHKVDANKIEEFYDKTS
jgi:hypothetical protein